MNGTDQTQYVTVLPSSPLITQLAGQDMVEKRKIEHNHLQMNPAYVAVSFT